MDTPKENQSQYEDKKELIQRDLHVLKSSIVRDNTHVQQRFPQIYDIRQLSPQLQHQFQGGFELPEQTTKRFFVYEKLNQWDVAFLSRVPNLQLKVTGSTLDPLLAPFVGDLEAPHISMKSLFLLSTPRLHTLNGMPYRTPFLSTNVRPMPLKTEFFRHTGTSFYLNKYASSIGIETESLKNIESQIESATGSFLRVWLTLSSKDKNKKGEIEEGNLLHHADGTPKEWKNLEKMIIDVRALLNAAEKSKKKLILTLHSSDLYKYQSDFVTDPQKQKLFFEKDKEFLQTLWHRLSDTEKETISYIEFMNEPDHVSEEINHRDVYQFVEKGVQMIRNITQKPISIGPAKIYNMGQWTPLLQPNDCFQVHWYRAIEDQYEEDPYTQLQYSMKTANVPAGCRIILGEAQGNVGNIDITNEVIQYSRQSGYDGVLFWFDNRKNPKYTKPSILPNRIP